MSHENKQLPLFQDETRLPTGKNHISYSELFDWYECSYRHKLRYVDKIELDGPSIHTEFGQVVHGALEDYVKTGQMPPVKDCLRDFERRLGELMFSTNEVASDEAEQFVEALPQILEQVPPWLDSQFPGWKLYSAEEFLFEPIDGQTNKHFKGFIDLVIKAPKRKKPSKTTRLSDLQGTETGDFVYWVIDWKGQRLSAPILTPYGWTTMGQLAIGDKISNSSGGVSVVNGIYPLGKRDIYRVTLRDGSYTEVTEDHLWKVYNTNGYSKILNTLELQREKYYRYLPTPSAPIEFDDKDEMLVDPYVLGLLLGDGSFKGTPRFTSEDESLVKAIEQRAPEWFVTHVKQETEKCPSYSITGASKDFAYLGLTNKLSHEKEIPNDYLFSSVTNRLELLQGLLDSDGWVQKGIAKFSTTSQRLAAGVKHLTLSLGGVAFMSERHKPRKGENHPEYIVTVRLPEGFEPFKLERKLQRWNPESKHRSDRRKIQSVECVDVDEAQCISVSAEDNLYITEDFIVTHNTTNWGWRSEQKRAFEKQLQLMLYKYFWCKRHNVELKDARAGWAFLKRKPKKDGSRIDLLPVSVGPKAAEKALSTLHDAINQIDKGMAVKNKWSCRFCRYKGTEHCP